MRLVRCLLACALALSACHTQDGPTRTLGGEVIPAPARAYGPDAAGLHALWSDVLQAAQRDERERVHDLLASTIMSDADLSALFGPEQARRLAPRYRGMIAQLVNEGALGLVVQVYERKYDDVEVFRVAAKDAAPELRAVLSALREPVDVYGVRVKKKADHLGLRYDCFIFRDGRWITGNQIGQFLIAKEATKPAAPPAKPAVPDRVKPGDPVAQPVAKP